MKYLNNTDWAVIGAYAVIVVLIGVYLRRRASRSMEDYFLAGRQLPWWALGVSGMLNFLDMTGTMVIVSFLYMLGPRGLYVEFRGGAVLVLAFMMLWTGKWHYRSRCLTAAEWNIYRFGPDPMAKAARAISALAGIIFTFGMLAYLIKGAGLFLSMFLPYSPFTCALFMIVLTTVYTLMSGFYGVVYTDLFQSAIVFVSVVLISVLAVMQVWNYDGDLGALAYQVTNSPKWMSSVPHLKTEVWEGYEDFRYLAVVAAFYLFRNILGGMCSGGDPRYFGARSERECGLLTFFWTWLMTFRWPMMMGFAVMGLFLVRDLFPDHGVLNESAREIKRHFVMQAYPDSPNAIDDQELVKKVVPKSRWEDIIADITQKPDRYPELVTSLKGILGETDWEEKLSLVGYEAGQVNPERILPAIILMRIPMGVRGLLLVSLVAAAMSTFSPQVNWATSLFTHDIFRAFLRPRAGNRELIAVSWGFGVLVVVGGFLTAYSSSSINDIWDWIIMGLSAGLAIPGLLKLYWWRFNSCGVVVGTFVGLTGAIIQRAVAPELGPYHKFLLHTTLSLAGAVIGTYLAPPTDRSVLEHFYRTTRPFGFWGPLRSSLPAGVLAAMRKEHFHDLISLPFALGWQVTLFLLPMQLIIGSFRAFWVTLPIFLICLAGLYWFWYRNLPPAEQPGQEAETRDASPAQA